LNNLLKKEMDHLTINDLRNHWQDRLEKVQPESRERLDQERPDGAGMHVRSDLHAGISALLDLIPKDIRRDFRI
jgi:hypothetical protein